MIKSEVMYIQYICDIGEEINNFLEPYDRKFLQFSFDPYYTGYQDLKVILLYEEP